MSQSRLEWKVGAFVVMCLAVLVTLLIQFTKGTTLFEPTIEVILKTTNVGGIKPKAAVLLAGVPVGSVGDVIPSPDGRAVFIHLKIKKRYKIFGDATFIIEAQGFLGDQYVSIVPGKNEKPPLEGGEVRECREPFNIQDAARSALGLIQQMEQTVVQLREAMSRVDRTVLAEQTLSNVVATVEDIRRVTDQSKAVVERLTTLEDKALATVDRVDLLIQTNTAPFRTSVSNLLEFSDQLTRVGRDLQQTVSTNRADLTSAIRNIEATTVQVTNLLADLQAGKGLAGRFLKDEQVAKDFSLLVASLPTLSSNANALVVSAGVFTTNANQLFAGVGSLTTNGNAALGEGTLLFSNLNRYGLFYQFLVKPKAPKTNTTATPRLPMGHNPFKD